MNCLLKSITVFEAEELPEYKTLKDIIYWYASDYCDVFLADRIEEQICPCYSFAADIIMGADLDDERYLYRFGEYITENELGTARHLNGLPEETLRKMADVCAEGYVRIHQHWKGSVHKISGQYPLFSRI